MLSDRSLSMSKRPYLRTFLFKGESPYKIPGQPQGIAPTKERKS
jgi:hypothetical protein